MAEITTLVQSIRQAVYGADVRESLASGIEAINTEVESTTQRQADVETMAQAAINNGGNPSIEVGQARIDSINNITYANLQTRLNANALQLDEQSTQLNNLDINKAEKTDLSITNNNVNNLQNSKADKTYADNIQTQVNNLVLNVSGTDITEVVQSRGRFSVLNDRIADIENLNSKVEQEEILNLNYTTDKYIDTYGTVLDYTGLQYSDTIVLKKGDVLRISANGLTSQVSVLSRFSLLGTFMNNIYSGTNGTRTYYYICNSDSSEYVKVCGTVADGVIVSKFKLNVKIDIFNDLKTKFDLLTDKFYIITPQHIEGKYINSYGDILDSEGYYYTDPIQLYKGDTIKVKAYGYSTNVSILSSCSSDGVYKRTIAVSNGTEDIYSYTAVSETEYVKVSCNYIDYSPLIMILASQQLNNEDMEYYTELFENVICIGDSLTEGDYETNGNYDVRIHSYPFFMSKLTNWSITNAGCSGATASSYWNIIQGGGQDVTFSGYSGESHHRVIPGNFSSYDTAIILLGENEGLTDTLVADTTITEGQTYLNYANTHTGNYCKIIEKIKADKPNCKIFLCVVPQNASERTATNAVIQQIATKYNLPYLDLYNDCIMTKDLGSLYRPQDNIHYGKLGYLTLAKTIKELICKYVSNNLVKYIN